MTTDDEPGVLQDLRDILASDLTQWSTGHVCDTGVHYDEGVMRGSTDTLRRVISLIDALAAAPDSDATDVQRRAKACNEPGAVPTGTPQTRADLIAQIHAYAGNIDVLVAERDAALRLAEERAGVIAELEGRIAAALAGHYEIEDEYCGGDLEEGIPMVQIWHVRHYKPIMMGTPINRRGYKTREDAESALAAALAAGGSPDSGGKDAG